MMLVALTGLAILLAVSGVAAMGYSPFTVTTIGLAATSVVVE